LIRDTSYELEAQRQAARGGLLFGGALEVGTNAPTYGAELVGIAGLIGSSWHGRRWLLETTAGLGLELARLSQASRTVTNSSLTGASSSTVTNTIEPLLFVRGVATAGIPISTSLDLVARLGIHLGSSGGFETAYLSATVGLRFRIP